jgi:hypothetical protein
MDVLTSEQGSHARNLAVSQCDVENSGIQPIIIDEIAEPPLHCQGAQNDNATSIEGSPHFHCDDKFILGY